MNRQVRDLFRNSLVIGMIAASFIGGCTASNLTRKWQRFAVPPAPAPRSVWVVERTPERVELDKVAAELEKHVSEASAHVDAIVHRSLKDGQSAPLDADLAAIHKTLAKIEAASVKLRATDATVATDSAATLEDPLSDGPRDARRNR